MASVRASQNGYHRLPRKGPETLLPVEILTVSLRLRSDDGVAFVFEDRRRFRYTDPVQVIRYLRGDPDVPAPDELIVLDPLVPKEHPLEIFVRNPCIIIVMLDPGGPLRFRASGPAITSKADYGDDNSALAHVSDKFEPMSDRTPGVDCFYAHFRVAQRGHEERQSFNFHLDLKQNGEWLEISIDPDVPDDGGGVPPK